MKMISLSTLIGAHNSLRIDLNARMEDIVSDDLVRYSPSFLLYEKSFQRSRKLILNTNWKLSWHVTGIVQIAAG